MKRIVLILLILLLPFLALSQSEEGTAVFDIIYKGDDIGDLLATKKVNGESITYKVETDIVKKILHVKKCHYDVTVEYINGKLHESDYELYINDKLDKWVKIQDTGSMVVGSKNGRKTKELGPEFEYSSALFFFNEPKGVISTLSESKMKSRGVGPHESEPNVYVLDKNKGSYHYEEGKLIKVVVKDVVDMEMVRRQ